MESVIMYKSFHEAIKELKPSDKLKVYDAVFNYSFEGIEPKLTGVCKAVFALIKPQIDANTKRRQNGTLGAEHGIKGGRPKKEKPIGVSENNAIGVSEITPNVNVNDNVNDNVNVKENIKEKPHTKHKHGVYNKVMLTDEEYSKLVKEYGEDRTMAAIKFLDEYIAEKDYKSKSHYLAIRRWVIQALNDRKGKASNNARLGVFADYKQTSGDDEWDSLTDLALKEVNGL